MNIALVLRVVAILMLIISGFMLIPVVVAVAYGEFWTIPGFLIPVGVSVALALFYLLITRREYGFLSNRGGFLLVSLAWLIASLIGALPFVLTGAMSSYVDAFFETMSGFTTTGASILTEIEGLPRSVLFWRSLTHWLGGMGIIVLTVAIFPLLGIGGLQIIKAEAPGPTVDKITPKITETAKILWFTYLTFTVAQVALLLVGGMDLFDALTHTFGTLATGGFSPKNGSVGHYDSAYIDAVVTLFMVMAGINFSLYYKLITGRFTSIRRDTEVKAYLSFFVLATLVIAVSLYGAAYESVGKSLRYAAFQAASILTTTGYATADFAAWPALAQIVLFALMFIGGSAGSTGGGIKVVRIVTLFKQGLNEMKYLLHPRAVFRIRLNREPVGKHIVYAISGFVFLYSSLLLITTILVAAAGNDILTSLTTALATLGNIGPGFGKVGPTLNYAFFPDALKVYLSIIMMLGRLEVYTVLIIFTPQFWRV
ncbi:MAG: TrkH family potassium uptake protein [Alkalispirochaetaceae bacterium]